MQAAIYKAAKLVKELKAAYLTPTVIHFSSGMHGGSYRPCAHTFGAHTDEHTDFSTTLMETYLLSFAEHIQANRLGAHYHCFCCNRVVTKNQHQDAYYINYEHVTMFLRWMTCADEEETKEENGKTDVEEGKTRSLSCRQKALLLMKYTREAYPALLKVSPETHTPSCVMPASELNVSVPQPILDGLKNHCKRKQPFQAKEFIATIRTIAVEAKALSVYAMVIHMASSGSIQYGIVNRLKPCDTALLLRRELKALSVYKHMKREFNSMCYTCFKATGLDNRQMDLLSLMFNEADADAIPILVTWSCCARVETCLHLPHSMITAMEQCSESLKIVVK